jgi:hypothetical protein
VNGSSPTHTFMRVEINKREIHFVSKVQIHPLPKKCISKCLKKLDKICRSTSRHPMLTQKVSRKKDILQGQCKEDNFRCFKIAFHATLFCHFYTIHKKYVFVHKLFCENIECPVHN